MNETENTYKPIHYKQFHLISDHKTQDALVESTRRRCCFKACLMPTQSIMYLTATLSWLGSSHAKGSHITLHKNSYLYQFLRTLGLKCVKVVKRLKERNIFFPHQKCLTRLSSLTSTPFKKRHAYAAWEDLQILLALKLL